MILILDFGSQYTQLIAKQLRQNGFESQVLSGKTRAETLISRLTTSDINSKIRGIILSGSWASVGQGFDPDGKLFELGIPVLGLCFGYQSMAALLGGKVASSSREYGSAIVEKTTVGEKSPLLQDLPQSFGVWMSHGDSVVAMPTGAEQILVSNGKLAGYEIAAKKLWGLQFHPEVTHTPLGGKILENFASRICGELKSWSLKQEIHTIREKLDRELKNVPEVLCAVSGGVDSTVLAVLLASHTKVRALFVDHGLNRSYDLSDLQSLFAKYPGIHLEVVDAKELFLSRLEGISDPEQKRKIVGSTFIEVFQTSSRKLGIKHLAQGTIYSDVIESAANELHPAEKIKSHHNVGGLPLDHGFDLVEPLRSLFKDEVRELGRALGITEEFLARHPFPGPGLSIRVVGALSRDRIEMARRLDTILADELRKRDLYSKVWQAGVILLPISTVGVMGDGRSFESVAAIRAVWSQEAMTAEASELPWPALKAISSRMVNEVRGVNRVVFDLTSKPPATIEWE